MQSHAESKRVPAVSRRFRVGPFFKALLVSLAIEVAILLLTLDALGSSFMRHSAAAPAPLWEDLAATLCLIYHFPSIMILAPFQLFFLAPLIQIALVTYVLGLILQARESARLR